MPELGFDGTRTDPIRVADGHDLDLDGRPGRTATPAVGKPRGNKQEVPLHLPRATFDALATYADDESVSRGVAVMRSLRASHAELVRELAPAADTDGPFPAERRSRRRIRVDQAVRTSVLLWPDEAAALARVADELDLSCSELVTLAIDRHLSGAAAAAG
jgi:hypothetical protein